jgi:hypothetical protein
MGRSLLNLKGDRTRLLPPPNTWRPRHQQLVEHRLALSILRIVARLLWGPSLRDYPWAPHRKRPPGVRTSLRITPFQDLVSPATNKPRAA